MPLFNLDFFLLGALGGALPDIIRIIKGRYKLKPPKYLKSLNFWLGFILLILLGGAAAWLFGAQDVKSALAMGFSAPEIFSNLASKSEDEEKKKDPKFRLRGWWAA